MTNQEAIDILRRAVAAVEWEYPMEIAAAIDKTVELLKAQEPLKPIMKQEMDDICSCFDNIAYCGKCGAYIGRLKRNYCSDCGHAVKWDEPPKEET